MSDDDQHLHSWRPSIEGEVPLSDVVAHGTTAVAYGVRGDVLYVLDVYEVEAANAIPHEASRTFWPVLEARPVSHWQTTICVALACLVIAGWLLGSVYYLTFCRSHA